MTTRFYQKIPAAHRAVSKVAAKDLRPVESSLLYLYDQLTHELGDTVPHYSDYTITAEDDVILMSGDVTTYLPTAVGATGSEKNIKNVGTGTVTLATSLNETIDGEATQSIGPGECITCVSDNANWWVI